MRRLLKFLHTLGAIGLMGAMACLLALLAATPSSPAGHAVAYFLMSKIATWILTPSLVLTLVSGLLAIAWNRAFHDAGWAWAKAATGILLFEGGLVYIQGPIKEQAEVGADILAGASNAATLTDASGAQQGSLWVLLGVAAANVVLGIWRPKLSRRRS